MSVSQPEPREEREEMLIKELNLKGILSFGHDSPPLALRPLNVLIGANGSGKSNLIAAIDLLRSSPGELAAPIRGIGGGGVSEWIWKEKPNADARIEALLSASASPKSVRHLIEFRSANGRFELADECIEYAGPFVAGGDPALSHRFEDDSVVLTSAAGEKRRLEPRVVKPNESILSQVQDPSQYPELAHLADAYRQVRIYRDWSFGFGSPLRVPQRADLPTDRLAENFSNLGLYLNYLRRNPEAKRTLLERLRDLYDGLKEFDVQIEGGTVQVFFEEDRFITPAVRLSDGSLRYLCLLAVLCDPNPPPLICIEEPELGLHPDLMPTLSRLLREASRRSQLIVTTHSDALVDSFTETPEDVIVCEKRSGRTELERLNRDNLVEWLEEYGLGGLWTRGDLGGNRW